LNHNYLYSVWILFLNEKGIPFTKRKILSFTHPQVVPNLYEFLSSAENKRRYLKIMKVRNKTVVGPH